MLAADSEVRASRRGDVFARRPDWLRDWSGAVEPLGSSVGRKSSLRPERSLREEDVGGPDGGEMLIPFARHLQGDRRGVEDHPAGVAGRVAGATVIVSRRDDLPRVFSGAVRARRD